MSLPYLVLLRILCIQLPTSYLEDIRPRLDTPEEDDRFLGLADFLDLVGDHQGEFGHLIDHMS